MLQDEPVLTLGLPGQGWGWGGVMGKVSPFIKKGQETPPGKLIVQGEDAGPGGKEKAKKKRKKITPPLIPWCGPETGST